MSKRAPACRPDGAVITFPIMNDVSFLAFAVVLAVGALFVAVSLFGG